MNTHAFIKSFHHFKGAKLPYSRRQTVSIPLEVKQKITFIAAEVGCEKSRIIRAALHLAWVLDLHNRLGAAADALPITPTTLPAEYTHVALLRFNASPPNPVTQEVYLYTDELDRYQVIVKKCYSELSCYVRMALTLFVHLYHTGALARVIEAFPECSQLDPMLVKGT